MSLSAEDRIAMQLGALAEGMSMALKDRPAANIHVGQLDLQAVSEAAKLLSRRTEGRETAEKERELLEEEIQVIVERLSAEAQSAPGMTTDGILRHRMRLIAAELFAALSFYGVEK